MARKNAKVKKKATVKKGSSKSSNNKKTMTKKTEQNGLGWRLEEHIAQASLAILFFVLSVFFVLSYFDKAGVAGEHTFRLFDSLLGMGYFLLPLVTLFLSISFTKKMEVDFAISKSIGTVLFLLSGLGIIEIATERGGFIGNLVSSPLLPLFDLYITMLILFAFLALSLVILFDIKISKIDFARLLPRRREKEDEEIEVSLPTTEPAMTAREAALAELRATEKTKEEKVVDTKPEPKTERGGILGLGAKKKTDEEKIDIGNVQIDASRLGTPFTPPPLTLLSKDSGKPSVGDVRANANLIKRTLKNFGIDVEMDEVSVGPSVTRYALKPAEGVKLSRIEGLQKEIQAALAAKTIRIEAPIPGKSLVGIEIPNVTKSTVGMASLLADSNFAQSDKPLLVTLGRNLAGRAEFSDLAKMPHLLVAGATGAGKSVTVHMLIASLLYRNPPESLKFIMVDPKRVELTLYNDIPHLLTPVIKNAKKAILALRWAAKEMERRYDLLESHRVQNIDSYHKNILAPAIKKLEKKGVDPDEVEDELPETMPYIVIIIDELADIMSAYPKELEAAIVRLAQMSRAVGIHLILSTQRPDVKVITGLIKANIPARIALQVSSQIDSRTIIDKAGAEKLLGKGDMLFQGGDMSRPGRIQSGFISEAELKRLTDWLIKHYSEKLQDTIDLDVETRENETESIFTSVSMDDEEEDDKYEEAKETVIQAGRASTSYLQRRLGIGYSRAARLIDTLEERGIIGPQNGSKPREVLVGKDGGGASEESNTYEGGDYEDNQKSLNNERF